ncbi:Por secretion system C-terminal sorting domain-containing protein [Arachidicoccus rhizosphaerae]|uniref:Por secretion system C-terminal sorting domain-containing protein n=1 Tax=Arachidicoccus rhizosphaerae TaxID=551991 RepID=A0A1H4BX00_9BACT|nr:T9SS type A sorting domain-containing protein [Arachidicoccus rhizosphaerae]SEA52372.1 Por secretion system C-terminal sorting domain-containing protein [Arachidicoccus rhizosphaerae]
MSQTLHEKGPGIVLSGRPFRLAPLLYRTFLLGALLMIGYTGFCQFVSADRQALTKDSSRSLPQEQASKEALIKKYYRLGLAYRSGDSLPRNYKKAFLYFSKAAELGDPQSVYAIGMSFYKGTGCQQNYDLAANYFRQGAYAGRDNSMYMLALCYRNDYVSVPNHLDSAKYWLQKAAALGYRQAIQELNTKNPEYTGSQEAEALLAKIHNAALPAKIPVNQFIAIQPVVPEAQLVFGDYWGYIINYDWSGRHIVSTDKLHLELRPDTTTTATNSQITGKWMEKDASVKIQADFKDDSLVFRKTKYRRKDHYSSADGIAYQFKDAALNFVRKDDSVFLAGNIYMFSEERNEPSKPILIALVRSVSSAAADSSLSLNKNKVKTADNTASGPAAYITSAYPNPFASFLNVAFQVTRASKVSVELYTINGIKVFAKAPENLNPGVYKIRIQPSLPLGVQSYILRIVYDEGSQNVKVIKR